MIKSYSELIALETFDERIEYLKLNGAVGDPTFAHDRYLNQAFYRTPKWKQTRNDIIIRDNGCDLGVSDNEITDLILVHHINPIKQEDIIFDMDVLYDHENLISSSKDTHDYIHYGKKRKTKQVISRSKNDTAPWRTE